VGNEQHGPKEDGEAAPAQPLLTRDADAAVIHPSDYGTHVKHAAVLLLALLFVSGCGGGGGGSKRLSRAEYASKADAVCGKYNQQTRALQNPTSLSELAKVADKTLPILDNAIRDLRKLKPPANEQATVDEWLAGVENLKGDLTEIRDKAKGNDMAGVQAVVPKAQEHNTRSNQLATQLGMSVCNRD
jgi:hypothetical protein